MTVPHCPLCARPMMFTGVATTLRVASASLQPPSLGQWVCPECRRWRLAVATLPLRELPRLQEDRNVY